MENGELRTGWAEKLMNMESGNQEPTVTVVRSISIKTWWQFLQGKDLYSQHSNCTTNGVMLVWNYSKCGTH